MSPSFPYRRGHIAATHGIHTCPYAGRTAGSRRLRAQWLAGHFDRSFARLPRHRGPRGGVAYRKRTRVRWPRSAYARRRLQEALRA